MPEVEWESVLTVHTKELYFDEALWLLMVK